tara:strand:- start:961 stop:1416 length:456 start_codon:yes stop_codon:yes gene_type:complete
MFPIAGFAKKILKLIDNPVGQIVNKLLTGRGADELTPKEKQDMQLQVRQSTMELVDEAMESDAGWRDFMLQYEGSAEDQHSIIKILRGSVRPVITYAILGELFVLLNGWATISTNNVPPEFWTLSQMVLGFWFGGRMLEGVIQSVKTGKKS